MDRSGIQTPIDEAWIELAKFYEEVREAGIQQLMAAGKSRRQAEAEYTGEGEEEFIEADLEAQRQRYLVECARVIAPFTVTKTRMSTRKKSTAPTAMEAKQEKPKYDARKEQAAAQKKPAPANPKGIEKKKASPKEAAAAKPPAKPKTEQKAKGATSSKAKAKAAAAATHA